MEPTRSSAIVATDRPARYAKQLVAHMSRKVSGAFDDTVGVGHLEFGESRVELNAAPGHLDMRLVAPPEDVDRVEHVVGIHLARFGAKDELVVSWTRADGSPGTTQTPPHHEHATP